MGSLFQQTLREQDAIFYATFPAAALHKLQEEQQQQQQQQQHQLQLHYDYEDDLLRTPTLEHAYYLTEQPRAVHPYRRPEPPRVSPVQRPPVPQPQLHPNAPPPAMRLSPLPSKRQLEKKPPLACLFCRGRKIACGSPLPGSPDKTCNQCQRRSLQCEYPSESRRGMRKKKPVDPPGEPAAPKVEASSPVL